MNEEKAREILKEAIKNDNSLHSTEWYLNWNKSEDGATLDGVFDIEDLEAISWWIKNIK